MVGIVLAADMADMVEQLSVGYLEAEEPRYMPGSMEKFVGADACLVA